MQSSTESRFFLLCLHDDGRIRIQSRIHTSDWWIRIREAQKHVDPVDPDPDPQHWLIRFSIITLSTVTLTNMTDINIIL